MSRTVALFLVTFCLSANAFATVPPSITVQGKLSDAFGNPLPASAKTFQFRIFNDTSAGAQIWPAGGVPEQQLINTDAAGLWVARVGAINSLVDNDFDNPQRWLQINVDGTTLPRIRLHSEPYAFRTGSVDGATGGVITSEVSIGTGNTNAGVSAFVVGQSNAVLGDFSTIAGGSSNKASGDFSFVGGGGGAEPDSNSASGAWSSVVGGSHNVASGLTAFVGGGSGNIAKSGSAAIVGGTNNLADTGYNFIGGGRENHTDQADCIIGGGLMNEALGNTSSILGGRSNTASGVFSSILGGVDNLASGDNSSVGGGEGDTASGVHSVVCGGEANVASGTWSSVSGGSQNRVTGSQASIGGGATNNASGARAFIGGGFGNDAMGNHSGTLGGFGNEVSGYVAGIVGGENNRAFGRGAFVGGGGGVTSVDSNSASGANAVVLGGRRNTASGHMSFAAGYRARSNHTASFVWSDSALADFASTDINQFLIRASGGVGIGTNDPEAPLHIFESTAGTLTANTSSTAVFERSGTNVISLLSPDVSTRGIVFGEPSNVNAGGIYYNGTSTDGLDFRTNGNFVRMTLSSAGALNVTGAITGASCCAPSDARFKRNIESLPNVLDKVGQLRGVRYHWEREKFADREFPPGEQIGLIAQEVREVVPQAVVEQEDGYLAVDYARLVPLLIEGMKEQQRRIEMLEAKIESMTP